MRLLHQKTLEIAATRDDIPKTVISHVWSECFKFKKSGKPHPKMFIDDDYILGGYMRMVFEYARQKQCEFSKDPIRCANLVATINNEINEGYYNVSNRAVNLCFDDNYLFSDACSLYFKGINIFPDIFGNDWRKYVPVESRKEIHRQISKTLNKINL